MKEGMMWIRNSQRQYGFFVLCVLLGSLLWNAWDNQAHIYSPGWFSFTHRNVWCETEIDIPDSEEKLNFGHYPGKNLRRILKNANASNTVWSHYDELEESQVTTCFPTWQEAAENNPFFRELTQENQHVLNIWTEEQYRIAMLALSEGLRSGGPEQLQQFLEIQAERMSPQP